MFKNFFGQNNQGTQPQQMNATVRVIGDRASGKTTYMAALARWPNADPATSSVQTVTPINEDGENLITKACNLLEQGEQLEPTRLQANIDEVKDYSIRIVLKSKFASARANNLVALNINCKDYAGEFFIDLLHQNENSLLQDYLQDCLQASGLMLLFDGMSFRKDSQYANGVERFLKELDRSEVANTGRSIAFVLTKCEQPELWVNRHQPKKIAQARFPKVQEKLEAWGRLGTGKVDYFTTSAFGMLGNVYPEPNMKFISRDRYGLKEAILKNPGCWKPFGLVAPIYWLCTGERHKQLDQE